MKLSIIIPYYQTYDLTEKLLQTLEHQLKKINNVEIILIDDGCHEERLDKFNFLKITHLDKNYGASHAWNVGLSQAQGEYIGFIDSDDMIAPNYIDSLLYFIEKEPDADEIVFGFGYTNKDCIFKQPTCRAIWKAIYKRWLVPQFDESLKYNTDVPFNNHMTSTKHNKKFVPIVLYYYNSNRENSITWNKKRNLFKKEQ